MGYLKQALALYRDADSLGDFIRLMRVRLSQSKVGRWTTPRPITVAVNLKSLGRGVHLRSHTTDISVYHEIVLSHSLAGVKPDRTVRHVIDLGANTGLSYRWLRRLYPAAQIVCVEPDPGNLAILRANAQNDPACTVIAGCIGGRERQVNIASTIGEWGFRIVDGDDGTIPVITMDRLLDEHGIDRVDVLKCDIEGAEGEVFEDCRSWIDRVDTMTVECHLDVTDADGLCATLEANGANFRRTHLEPNPAWGFELITLQQEAHEATAVPVSSLTLPDQV